MDKAKSKPNLRQKISRRIQKTELPIVVYAVVLFSMFLLWRYQAYNEELAMNFFAELFGAAFTLFIIDILLVRNKAKKWKVVRDDLNYLIARNVNRIRDGISTRLFNFNPEIDSSLPEHQYFEELRKKRTDFLNEIVALDEKQLMKMINEEELFSEQSYDYFNEKAEEIWNILNIKYSDYFHPDLASYLITLNMNLKDLCGHIRQYMKSKRFTAKEDRYKSIGRQGATVCIYNIISLLNTLKEEGYSDAASMELIER